MPSRVASSSRERLPDPPIPPLPSARPRRSIRRATAAFVLAACAPYLTSASPIRATSLLAPGHDPYPAPTSAATGNSTLCGDNTPLAERIAGAAVGAALHTLQDSVRVMSDTLLGRSTSVTTPGQPQRRWAQLDIAHRDVNGVQVPQGYVALGQSVSPGFVVLSYLISLIGSLCTLELLLRRTSNRGYSNVALLTAAGCCFGAVSTFAMHFVGNQSLALHHPATAHHPDYPTMGLSYSAGFTVLSLVVSCGAMTFAFFVMGTDVRVREWRSWPCVPGSRVRRHGRRYNGRRSARDDYTRWKLQKTRLPRSHNIGTIFQQAGMVTSWSLMDSREAKHAHAPRSWRDLFLPTPTTASPPLAFNDTEGPFLDEEEIIKRDKELQEIDFRFGRNAAREEMDRRQIVHIASPPETESTAMSPEVSVSGLQGGQDQPPSSPMAAYYPKGERGPPGRREQDHEDEPGSQFRSPSPELFVPGFSFPARPPPLDTGSTSNLLPRPEAVSVSNGGNPYGHPYGNGAPYSNGHAPSPYQGATNGYSNSYPNSLSNGLSNPYSQYDAYGRRSSLPTVTLPPPPVRRTLARIQSLPEHEPEMTTIPSRQSIEKQSHGSLRSSSEPANQGSRIDPVVYDDELFARPRKPPGWRRRLRAKINSGGPLTRLEKAQRFLGLDVVTWGEVIKIMVTGMVAGWGVAAMHYIGQVSINDIPYIAYTVGNVVGSIVIASGAVIIALYIMFIMLRPKLKHSWMSKIIVAIILAGAVCGMHYCAMMGTTYGWPVDRPPTSSGMGPTKRAITGLVAALAFVACLASAVFVMINSIRDRKERARRRRVVVASVLLDDQDRMLVSAIDGLLPMCDIASLTPADVSQSKKGKRVRSVAGSDHTEASALGVDLSTGHEAFVQAMKMSWSWRNPFWSSMNPFASNTDLPPPEAAMSPQSNVAVHGTPHVGPCSTRSRRGSSHTTAGESVASSVSPTRLSVARFLEKFAVSATQLSVRLTGQQDGINRLGVLYDQILTTGWVHLRNSKDTVSKGQLIFLVRRVSSSQERSDLLSRHFIFADPASVAMSLHRTLSTPYEHAMNYLEDMRSFCDSTMRMRLRPNTLYTGVAIVQATPFDGLRILLEQRNRSQLPMREVCTFSTLPGLPVNVAEGLAGTLDEIGEAVTWLEGMSLLSVITRNMSAEAARVGGPRVGRLLTALERAIIPMLDELLSTDDMAYILPRLTLHPVLVPITPAAAPRAGHPGWVAPHIVVFYANYDVAVNTFTDKWLPFSLFRAQHECVMATKIDSVTRAAEANPATGGGRNTPFLMSPSQTTPSLLLGPTPGGPSPNGGLSPGGNSNSLSLDPGKYNYARRPSKVQFEVPNVSVFATDESPANLAMTQPLPSPSYTFPARDPGASAVSTPSPTAQGFTFFPSSRDRQPPRRSSLAKSVFRDDPEMPQRMPGVAQWDPEWLVHLLRTRLRADAS